MNSSQTLSNRILGWLGTTDHKKIGIMYLWLTLFMAVVGGGFAGAMRAQLAKSGLELISPEMYNQLLSMHGSLMIFFVIIPALAGFGNYFVPLLIGARDMAFPKLNAFSFWLLIPAGLLMFTSFFVIGGAAQAGWTSYPPLSSAQFSGTPGVTMWIFGIHLAGLSSILGAINFIVTILNMRAPGMGLFKMPLFVWTWLVNAFIILVGTPVLAGAVTMLLTDRLLGTGFFNPALGGDSLLYQHLFWFYSHPAVYIMILPGMGIISQVLPAFSKKHIFGYRGMVYSVAAIGFLGFLVWGHHMFAAGIPHWLKAYFSFASMLIAVPTGIKIFSWLATVYGGTIRFTTSMKFGLGFIALFILGGMSGVILANVPVDIQVHDSYFVVGHLHYVLFGGSVMALMAGTYFWFPKMSGKMLSEKLGNLVFWLLFIGMNVTFFPMHIMGIMGMSRRIYTYRPEFQSLNEISSFGYIIIFIGGMIFLYSIFKALASGEKASADPWDAYEVQRTFEWSVSSPPPPENFKTIPEIS